MTSEAVLAAALMLNGVAISNCRAAVLPVARDDEPANYGGMGLLGDTGFDARPLVAQKFVELSAQWRKDTAGVSSFTRIWSHPAYLAIIDMGPSVLPLLFADLRAKPEWWFFALQKITGRNPVRREDRGDLAAMTQRWLDIAHEYE